MNTVISIVFSILLVFTTKNLLASDWIIKEVPSLLKPYTEIECNDGIFKIILNKSVDDSSSESIQILDSLPFYEFQGDNTGIFIQNFSDSIAKYDDYGSRFLKRCNESGTYLPTVALLESGIMTPEKLDRVKGVAINRYHYKGKIIYRGLFICDDDPECLNSMGLKLSDKQIPITLNNCKNIVSAMADEFWFAIYLKITTDGKVDIPGFFLSNTPIYEDIINNNLKKREDIKSNILTLNRWIIDFYLSHGYSDEILYWPNE